MFAVLGTLWYVYVTKKVTLMHEKTEIFTIAQAKWNV